MRLPRPYIPFEIRLQVAVRQCLKMGSFHQETIDWILVNPTSIRIKIQQLLNDALGFGRTELDHMPALAQREFNPRTGKYTPDANDPAYLVYRLKDDHRTKTYLRGDGAQRSDVSQQRYLKRVAARKKPRAKFKPRKAKHIRRSHAVSGHGEKT